jgi:hypothetical protein
LRRVIAKLYRLISEQRSGPVEDFGERDTSENPSVSR